MNKIDRMHEEAEFHYEGTLYNAQGEAVEASGTYYTGVRYEKGDITISRVSSGNIIIYNNPESRMYKRMGFGAGKKRISSEKNLVGVYLTVYYTSTGWYVNGQAVPGGYANRQTFYCEADGNGEVVIQVTKDSGTTGSVYVYRAVAVFTNLTPVYKADGSRRGFIAIGQGSTRRKELMVSDETEIKDTLGERLDVKVGDYVEVDEGRFVLCEPYQPEADGRTGSLSYSLKLEAPYMLWRNRTMKLEPGKNGMESSFSVTDTLNGQMTLVLANLEAYHNEEKQWFTDNPSSHKRYNFHYNSLGNASDNDSEGAYSCILIGQLGEDGYVSNNGYTRLNRTTGGAFDTVEAKCITYNSTNIIEALNLIAEAWKLEWWIVESTIYFGKCTTDIFAKNDNLLSYGELTNKELLLSKWQLYTSSQTEGFQPASCISEYSLASGDTDEGLTPLVLDMTKPTLTHATGWPHITLAQTIPQADLEASGSHTFTLSIYVKRSKETDGSVGFFGLFISNATTRPTVENHGVYGDGARWEQTSTEGDNTTWVQFRITEKDKWVRLWVTFNLSSITDTQIYFRAWTTSGGGEGNKFLFTLAKLEAKSYPTAVDFNRIELVRLEEGEDLMSLKPVKNDGKYATRIYGFGGETNISGKYRKYITYYARTGQTGAILSYPYHKLYASDASHNVATLTGIANVCMKVFDGKYLAEDSDIEIRLPLLNGQGAEITELTKDGGADHSSSMAKTVSQITALGERGYSYIFSFSCSMIEYDDITLPQVPPDGKYRLEIKVWTGYNADDGFPTDALFSSFVDVKDGKFSVSFSPVDIDHTYYYPAIKYRLTFQRIALSGMTYYSHYKVGSFNCKITATKRYPAYNNLTLYTGLDWASHQSNVILFPVKPNDTFDGWQYVLYAPTLARDTYYQLDGLETAISRIPSEFFMRDTSDEAVQKALVKPRLLLPKETGGYIDVFDDTTPFEIVEEVVVADDIYPKLTLNTHAVIVEEETYDDEDETGSKVRKTRNVYTVVAYNGSARFVLPKEAIIAEELCIMFMTGQLAGMTFKCENKIKDYTDSGTTAKASYLHIIPSEDYGAVLPSGDLAPAVDDEFILTGWDTAYFKSLNLEGAAELELQTYIEAYAKTIRENYSYEVVHAADRAKAGGVLSLGQRVRLTSSVLGIDVESRIIKQEYPLDYPYDNPTYTIGERSKYSRLAAMEDKIEGVGHTRGSVASAVRAMGVSGGVVIVRIGSSIEPTDNNVFSAARVIADFLSKDEAQAIYADVRKDVHFQKGVTVAGNISVNGDSTVGGSEVVDEDLLVKGQTTIGQVPEGAQPSNAKLQVFGASDLNGSVNVANNLTAAGNISGQNATASQKITSATAQVTQSAELGTFSPIGLGGARAYIGQNNQSYLTIDNLNVRAQMRVKELIVEKAKAVGGTLVISPASGVIDRVEWLNRLGKTLAQTEENRAQLKWYRCYLSHDDGENVSNELTWMVGDLVYCKTYGIRQGVTYGYQSRNYWREVGHVDVIEEQGSRTIYIDLDATVNGMSTESFDSVPAEGDNIAVLGHRTHEEERWKTVSIDYPVNASGGTFYRFDDPVVIGSGTYYCRKWVSNDGLVSIETKSGRNNMVVTSDSLKLASDDYVVKSGSVYYMGSLSFNASTTGSGYKIDDTLVDSNGYAYAKSNLFTQETEFNVYAPSSPWISISSAVVHLGIQHVENAPRDRMNAIVISAYGDDSPSEYDYEGIDAFDKLNLDSCVFAKWWDAASSKYKVHIGKGDRHLEWTGDSLNIYGNFFSSSGSVIDGSLNALVSQLTTKVGNIVNEGIITGGKEKNTMYNTWCELMEERDALNQKWESLEIPDSQHIPADMPEEEAELIVDMNEAYGDAISFYEATLRAIGQDLNGNTTYTDLSTMPLALMDLTADYTLPVPTGDDTYTTHWELMYEARRDYVEILDYCANAIAQIRANLAKYAANAAQSTADAAQMRLNNWASDGKISPTEKTGLEQQKNDILAEYSSICENASKYSVSTNAYTTAKNKAIVALDYYTAAQDSQGHEYITIITDSQADSDASPRYSRIAAYYTARTTILNAIATAAKTAISDAQSAANTAASDALAALQKKANYFKSDGNVSFRPTNYYKGDIWLVNATGSVNLTLRGKSTAQDCKGLTLVCTTDGTEANKYMHDSFASTDWEVLGEFDAYISSALKVKETEIKGWVQSQGYKNAQGVQDVIDTNTAGFAVATQVATDIGTAKGEVLTAVAGMYATKTETETITGNVTRLEGEVAVSASNISIGLTESHTDGNDNLFKYGELSDKATMLTKWNVGGRFSPDSYDPTTVLVDYAAYYQASSPKPSTDNGLSPIVVKMDDEHFSHQSDTPIMDIKQTVPTSVLEGAGGNYFTMSVYVKRITDKTNGRNNVCLFATNALSKPSLVSFGCDNDAAVYSNKSDNANRQNDSSWVLFNIAKKDIWVRLWATFMVGGATGLQVNDTSFSVYFYSNTGGTLGEHFYLTRAKLEKGLKPTVWLEGENINKGNLQKTGIDIEQGIIHLRAEKVVVDHDFAVGGFIYNETSEINIGDGIDLGSELREADFNPFGWGFVDGYVQKYDSHASEPTYNRPTPSKVLFVKFPEMGSNVEFKGSLPASTDTHPCEYVSVFLPFSCYLHARNLGAIMSQASVITAVNGDITKDDNANTITVQVNTSGDYFRTRQGWSDNDVSKDFNSNSKILYEQLIEGQKRALQYVGSRLTISNDSLDDICLWGVRGYSVWIENYGSAAVDPYIIAREFDPWNRRVLDWKITPTRVYYVPSGSSTTTVTISRSILNEILNSLTRSQVIAKIEEYKNIFFDSHDIKRYWDVTFLIYKDNIEGHDLDITATLTCEFANEQYPCFNDIDTLTPVFDAEVSYFRLWPYTRNVPQKDDEGATDTFIPITYVNRNRYMPTIAPGKFMTFICKAVDGEVFWEIESDEGLYTQSAS